MRSPQTLLIIDDEKDVHYSFKRLLAKEPLNLLTASSGKEGLELVREQSPDVVVMDVRMGEENGLDTLRKIREHDPKQIVLMMTAYGTSQTAIEAMKLGAYDYVLKPFDIPQLQTLLQRALSAARAMREVVELSVPAPKQSSKKSHASEADTRTSIIGHSPAMQEVYKLVGQVAPTDATVLIMGASGTGKELIARAVYTNSTRHDQTYIAINCAAIPENLLESELFGHEKGAFTGAVSQRPGKFEQCHGGTLFLDEIGELPLTLQAKLLRVLQDGEFFRVGGMSPIRVNVRIIAATNRNLAQAVQEKKFREDLYYRLNVFNIVVPTLAQRKEDIPDLVTYFIRKWCPKSKDPTRIRFSEETLRQLQQHPWHGNVRELENAVQRAIVLATGDVITPHDLPPEICPPVTPSSCSVAESVPTQHQPSSLQETLRSLFQFCQANPKLALLPAVERELIIYALEQTMGNQVKSAKMLGITRATLRKRIDRFGLAKSMKIQLQ